MFIDKDDSITFRVPSELKKQFEEVTDKKHINRSALLRSWVEEYVERREGE